MVRTSAVNPVSIEHRIFFATTRVAIILAVFSYTARLHNTFTTTGAYYTFLNGSIGRNIHLYSLYFEEFIERN
jgi:hypothetical protein